MSIPLRQGTTRTLRIGPFRATDGINAKTGLTLSTLKTNTKISKADAASGAIHDTTVFTEDVNGYYFIELDTTDTNTLGRLRLTSTDASNYLQMFMEFEVYAANVYDALFTGSDLLQIDLTQIAGDTQSATDLKDFADAGYDPATNKVQGVVLVDAATEVANPVTLTSDYDTAKTASTQTSVDAIPVNVWGFGTRTLTSGGGASAADVWNYLVSALGDVTTMGGWLYAMLSAINSRVQSNTITYVDGFNRSATQLTITRYQTYSPTTNPLQVTVSMPVDPAGADIYWTFKFGATETSYDGSLISYDSGTQEAVFDLSLTSAQTGALPNYKGEFALSVVDASNDVFQRIPYPSGNLVIRNAPSMPPVS